MSTTRVRLPESLHEPARQLADEEGISVHQLIATALPERISALDTAACLEARAVRSSREDCDAVLASVPDVPPLPRDELPPKLAPKRTRGVG
jgi:hypothetical protein